MPRVVASIEARMNASRLPGKVLMDIGGRAALGRMLDRVRKCQTLDGIVIATTDRPADDAIAAWCRAEESTASVAARTTCWPELPLPRRR